MTDELVEKVALAIADAYFRSASNGHLTLQDTDTIPEDWANEARAAIAIVLEEAAKVAESCEWWTSPLKDEDERGPIAAAIRALKGKTE